MKKHTKAFTYAPKIPSVISGDCTQTIRPEGKKSIEICDIILFHGWSGRPYRSECSWRLKVEVIYAKRCWIDIHGIQCFRNNTLTKYEWDSKILDRLALLDGIVPSTGIELKKVLLQMHDLSKEVPFKIIRWEIIK